MKKSEPELRALISAQKIETVIIQAKKFIVTCWVEEDTGRDSLVVVVEARRNPISWLAWSQVTAFGFYVARNGSLTEFQEHDYYAQGY